MAVSTVPRNTLPPAMMYTHVTAPGGATNTSRGPNPATLVRSVRAVPQPTRTGIGTEIWKPIPGFEGLYEVSDHGRVRSLDRVVHSENYARSVRGRMLKVNTAPDGRVSVNLFRDNIGYTRRVHRLVMEAFVGPCPEGMEVCHWNDNASDNRLSNLRYDTRSANTMDMIRNGRHNHARKTHCPRGHEFIPENLKPISQGRKNRR